jgi:hypothetical protein
MTKGIRQSDRQGNSLPNSRGQANIGESATTWLPCRLCPRNERTSRNSGIFLGKEKGRLAMQKEYIQSKQRICDLVSNAHYNWIRT